MNIQRFKDDHAAIMTSVTHLRELVKSGIEQNAAAIAQAIVAMSSAIKLHLAAEDRALYPALAQSSDPQVAQVGQKFKDEMGGLATAYLEFSRRWNTQHSVASNPEGFRSEANQIFQALHQRIRRENTELYPLAELT